MYCGKVSAPDYKEDESKKYLQEVETLTIKDTIAVVEPMYGSNGTFYVRVKDRKTAPRCAFLRRWDAR